MVKIRKLRKVINERFPFAASIRVMLNFLEKKNITENKENVIDLELSSHRCTI